MSTEIKVPTLGESVTEATIGQWFKKPGDRVEMDETLAELEIRGLVTDLRSGAPSVRATALESLAKIPDAEATAALAQGLADPIPDMRSRTIDLLEGRGGEGPVTALVNRLTVEPDPFIRIEIINALDELATPAAKAAIAKAATDDADETVRAVAASK